MDFCSRKRFPSIDLPTIAFYQYNNNPLCSKIYMIVCLSHLSYNFTSMVNFEIDVNKYIFICVRSDIRAGRNWQSRDHVFEDNLFDRQWTKTKARIHELMQINFLIVLFDFAHGIGGSCLYGKGISRFHDAGCGVWKGKKNKK